MIPSSQLGLTNSLDLYKCAKAFADIVIPQVSCWNQQKESWYGSQIVKCLSKPQRRRPRERHQTKGLMSKTISVHVRYKSVYISLPSSAKQQREITKFCIVYGTFTTAANSS